jgi:hypothetical protein
MRNLALTKRWTRAIAAAGLVSVLHVAAPARADAPGPPPETSSKLLPLPPPGTHRLIRIGPGALVEEDDHGRVTMVDETAPAWRRGQGLVGAALVMGIFSGGAVFFFGEQLDVIPGERGVRR